MESRQHNATKEPEIELFVKVGPGEDSCSLVVPRWLILTRLQLGVGGGNSQVYSHFGRLYQVWGRSPCRLAKRDQHAVAQ